MFGYWWTHYFKYYTSHTVFAVLLHLKIHLIFLDNKRFLSCWTKANDNLSKTIKHVWWKCFSSLHDCLCDFLFLTCPLANVTWRASLQLQEPLHGTEPLDSFNLNISTVCCSSLLQSTASNLDIHTYTIYTTQCVCVCVSNPDNPYVSSAGRPLPLPHTW